MLKSGVTFGTFEKNAIAVACQDAGRSELLAPTATRIGICVYREVGRWKERVRMVFVMLFV